MPDPFEVLRGTNPVHGPRLSVLMEKHGSDKGPFREASQMGHGYADVYEREFARFRDAKAVLLEVGVFKGASMRAWAEWFGPAAVLFGVDIQFQPEALPRPDHRTIYIETSVRNRGAMQDAAKRFGGFSIVVDDGSHVPEEQVRAFDILWPLVRSGGLYAIEDLHSSFFPDDFMGYQGTLFAPCPVLEEAPAEGFLPALVGDAVGRGKWAKWAQRDMGQPEGRELEVASVRFYRNLVIVEKVAEPPLIPRPLHGGI